jgi:hypothetical protein
VLLLWQRRGVNLDHPGFVGGCEFCEG